MFKLSHSSLNMINLTSISQMSTKNGDKWDWHGTFEIDQSMPIVPWGHLRFTSKSHLSLRPLGAWVKVHWCPASSWTHSKVRLTGQSHMSTHRCPASTVCRGQMRFTSQYHLSPNWQKGHFRLTGKSQMSLHRDLASKVCRGQMRLTSQSQMSPL